MQAELQNTAITGLTGTQGNPTSQDGRMDEKTRDFDTQNNSTPPASHLPAICASDLATSLPDGAPLSLAPELLDCRVEAETVMGGPQKLRTIKQRHVDHERECPSGKVPFLTSSGARAMLKTFKSRRDDWRDKDRHLTVYHCRECQRYHIGNAVNFQGGWKSSQGKRPRHLPDRPRKEKHRGRKSKS